MADRATGALAWRYPGVAPADGAPYVAASPAVRVSFIGSLDGRVYAFAQ